MIFNNKEATELFLRWKKAQDSESEEILEEFLDVSRSLLEAVTYKYSKQMDHDDLIQECTIRVLKALESYDPTITTLHTFLTTVIINHCNTCVNKEKRQNFTDLEIREDIEPRVIHDYSDNEIINDLIIRNRQRFPSLPTETIDEITELIYDLSKDGIANKSKGIIAAISEGFPINRYIAIVIYHSTLIYLRRCYIDRIVLHDVEDPDEFSLLYDFQEIFGDEAYIRIYQLFTGTFLKIP